MSLLPDAERFRRLVDGTARGPAATAARLGLAMLAVPYAAVVSLRNAAYDRGLLATYLASTPVISVGNLTLGGTGKTPLVAWLARVLTAAGRRPAIVSRGYAARAGETSDEAAELGILLPGVPHCANRDRVSAARVAAADGADAILLDDGFQHRRLRRDLDIVAIDATDPFGCDHLFPRGLLREPPRALARAQAVVLTRATSVSGRRRDEIRRAVLGAAGQDGGTPRDLVWAEATHAAVGIRDWTGQTRSLSDLAGRRVFAFAAIGNPAAFRRTLAEAGADVAGFRAYADHHAYTAAEVAAIGSLAQAAGAEEVLTTLKDLVKIRHTAIGPLPLAAVEIALDVSVGRAALEAAVIEVLRARDTSPGRKSGGGVMPGHTGSTTTPHDD
jgi:tetraacyldisaccharide 4'-kinase